VRIFWCSYAYPLVGCRWEARACENANTSRQKPAHRAQTRATAQERPTTAALQTPQTHKLSCLYICCSLNAHKRTSAAAGKLARANADTNRQKPARRAQTRATAQERPTTAALQTPQTHKLSCLYICCSLSAHKRTSAAAGKLARAQMPTQAAKSPHATHKPAPRPRKRHSSSLVNTPIAKMNWFAHLRLPECPQTHLGCRREARACANADTNRQKPARRAQTRATAQERPP
jgi:hypothetical protein